MLIFDPPDTSPVAQMHRKAFNSRIREHRFVFDKLFDEHAGQDDVFAGTAEPLLASVLDGFNATVFAYGATGCGKTHTISGTPDAPGVVFLAMEKLYAMIESQTDKCIDVSLSFLEIYNETIKDLLRPETDHKRLVIREDAKKKISVANLSSHNPASVQEVMELIMLGNKNRTCSPTEANATSSRSHAVLQINIISRDKAVDLVEHHTIATLSIIDLAGSERASATRNTGARLNEGANINKSLLALGNCINALCDPRRHNHVPYRDSKLTRLLKFSLGGNCKTVMIVCVSPSSQHYDETLNTLKYANRAKEIKTKVIRNQHNLDRHVGSYLRMITQQKQEIEELKAREGSVAERVTEKQLQLSDKCVTSLMDNIEGMKVSIAKHYQDKWRKCFLLARRKILIINKLRIEDLMNKLSHLDSEPSLAKICALGEQVVTQTVAQIKDIEENYLKASEIDFILHESSQHIHRRLKEMESWLDIYSVVFESKIDHLKDSVQKDILFESSILFDHLLHEVSESGLLVDAFVHLVTDSEKRDLALDLITESIESFLNGDFDSFLEEQSSRFMQRKLMEDNYDDESMNSEAASESILMHKKRDKRANSPLKTSPPRNRKKNTPRKHLLVPKFQPLEGRLASKKVHWDVANNSMADSELSFSHEESNIMKSDMEDNSPLQQNILDKLDDELEIRFDPTLNSPPLTRIISEAHKDKKGFKPRSRVSSLTNRKLSANENEFLSRLPLLNKTASTRILDPGYMSTPKTLNKTKIYTSPSEIMNQYNVDAEGRNVESSGTEKVE